MGHGVSARGWVSGKDVNRRPQRCANVCSCYDVGMRRYIFLANTEAGPDEMSVQGRFAEGRRSPEVMCARSVRGHLLVDPVLGNQVNQA